EMGRQALVLRRDMGGTIHDEALTREQEFNLIAVAHQAGVMVPRPRWFCVDPAVLGSPFFLMDRLEGESVGRRLVRAATIAEPGLGSRRFPCRQLDGRSGRLARRLRLGICSPGRPGGGPGLALRPLVAVWPGRAPTGRRWPGRGVL